VRLRFEALIEAFLASGRLECFANFFCVLERSVSFGFEGVLDFVGMDFAKTTAEKGTQRIMSAAARLKKLFTMTTGSYF
jgi:hypothetical protein